VAKALVVGMVNSVAIPDVVILPIFPGPCSTNHMLPSGPAVIPANKARAVGAANSVMDPAVVIRPMLAALGSVNQIAPSGPDVR